MIFNKIFLLNILKITNMCVLIELRDFHPLTGTDVATL